MYVCNKKDFVSLPEGVVFAKIGDGTPGDSEISEREFYSLDNVDLDNG